MEEINKLKLKYLKDESYSIDDFVEDIRKSAVLNLYDLMREENIVFYDTNGNYDNIIDEQVSFNWVESKLFKDWNIE